MVGDISLGRGLKKANQGNTAVVNKKCGNVITPTFITCDPARDTPQVVPTLYQLEKRGKRHC